MKIDHALDMPMHWRPNRLVARWFIGVYEKEPDMNPTLLKLAKLDFNIVQSFYKKEIDELTRCTFSIQDFSRCIVDIEIKKKGWKYYKFTIF